MTDYLVQINDIIRPATPEEAAVIEAEQAIPSIDYGTAKTN